MWILNSWWYVLPEANIIVALYFKLNCKSEVLLLKT